MKKNIVWALSLAVCAALLIAGCSGSQTGTGTIQQTTGSANESGQQETLTQYISGMYPEMTHEDMLERSTLVVQGEVTAQSEPFQITPITGGDPSNFTDYTVAVDQVLRGAAGDTVTVRVQGGLVDGMSTVVEDAPELTVGKQLLLYLRDPGDADTYLTDGTYYYVTGLWRGVYEWQTSDEGEFYVNQSNANDEHLKETWDAAELEAEIAAYNQSHPVEADGA